MKVLFLSHRHSDVQVGGLAEFLYQLPLALNTKQVKSFLYTSPDKKGVVSKGCHRNGMLHYTGNFSKPSFWSHSKDLEILVNICQEHEIDLVHAQGTYRAGFMALQLKKRIGLPYVVTSHSDILASNSVRARRLSFKRRCREVLRHSAAVTHLSPLMQQVSNAILNCDHKGYLIHNGIDLENWLVQAEELNYMLSIGRLEPEKGFRHLIDVFAALFRKGCQDALVIAGEGSDKDYLMQQAKKLGLRVSESMEAASPGTVIFPGYVRGSDKIALYQQAKTILFATQPDQWQESFGIVQLEAMAAAKTIIASDMPSTRYLSQLGMQAILLDPKDQGMWQAAITAVLADPAYRIQRGVQNRAAAQQFSWLAIASEYAFVYRTVKTL